MATCIVAGRQPDAVKPILHRTCTPCRSGPPKLPARNGARAATTGAQRCNSSGTTQSATRQIGRQGHPGGQVMARPWRQKRMGRRLWRRQHPPGALLAVPLAGNSARRVHTRILVRAANGRSDVADQRWNGSSARNRPGARGKNLEGAAPTRKRGPLHSSCRVKALTEKRDVQIRGAIGQHALANRKRDERSNPVGHGLWNLAGPTPTSMGWRVSVCDGSIWSAMAPVSSRDCLTWEPLNLGRLASAVVQGSGGDSVS